MTTGKKRSKAKEPVKMEGEKRTRTDSGTVIITEVSSSALPSSSFPSAATAVEPSSSSTTGTEATQEPVSLPEPITEAEGASNVIKLLQKIERARKKSNRYNYPVIIGSRAAAYWVPSFRACGDWDIVATPSQAIRLVKDSNSTNSNLNIKLIKQPLERSVIHRKPLFLNVKQAIETLPKQLYKISGEDVASHVKFEIEIAVNDQQGSTALCSATQLLKLCHENKQDASLMNVSFGSGKGTACMVAPIPLLEALKSSHIHWPAYFAKHIADLHTLRAIMAPLESPISTANIGVFADKDKSLTAPTRSPPVKDFLLARTLEVEAFRGTPGAHINLNMSNEDFLGREDDLFVTRHIPHDDVHAMIMYHETPIYDELKKDTSKAMVSKDLFEKATYEKQIQCVKEEAMVIALERFLLPKLTMDPVSAYRSALLRICTTLTKGWFRKFAVNNFPRLAVCDKNLLPIRDAILAKHPLPPVTRDDPLYLLRKTITNLDDLHLMKQMIALTKSVSSSNKLLIIGGDNDDSNETEYTDSDQDVYNHRDEDDQLNTSKSFWTICPTNPEKTGLFVSFLNEEYCSEPDCMLNINFHGTISVQPLTANLDVHHISAFKSLKYGNPSKRSQRDFHKIAVAVRANNGGGSWGGREIWSTKKVIARSLEKEVELLGVEGLTEDLLMAFIVAVVQPKLSSNGETPLRNMVNKYKAEGAIPVLPPNHLWYDFWKYHHLLK